MGREEIVERILSDARKEAEEALSVAEKTAQEIRTNALREEEALLAGVRTETAAKAKSIAEGKAATARLDGAKVLLSEKRRVLTAVYTRAYEKLKALGEKDCLALYDRLLKEYAEEGDEVVVGKHFPYLTAFEKLPVVQKKKLKITDDVKIEGGFILRGKSADTDLTYAALLARDKDEYQSAIAASLFK